MESLQELLQIVVFFVDELHIGFAVFILDVLLVEQLTHGVDVVTYFSVLDQPELQNQNENAGKDRVEVFHALRDLGAVGIP